MVARMANSHMANQKPASSSFCSELYILLYQSENRTSRRTAPSVSSRINATTTIGFQLRRGEKYPPEIRQNCRPHTVKRATPHTARSEEHTSELQSLTRTSYAVFCLKKTTSRNN